MSPQFGKTIIVVGLGLVAVGVLVKFNLLSWFGRLPGDFRIDRDNAHFYFPLASCLLISGLISLVSWLLRRFY